MKIETPNLILLACDQQTLEYAILGNQQLSIHIDAIVPDDWTEFGARALKYSLDKLKSSEGETGWWSYLPIHKAENKLIGLCGYKGQPNEKGQVEIGYEIKTEYRNKGLATELAKALIENAFNFETINSIQAHTLGEINASNKVLSNCGFQKIDEIDGKELGTLWKWELQRAKTTNR
jgi:[ribosomal protein S5]-alanine N-acetyltransferase